MYLHLHLHAEMQKFITWKFIKNESTDVEDLSELITEICVYIVSSTKFG